MNVTLTWIANHPAACFFAIVIFIVVAEEIAWHRKPPKR